MTKLKRLEDDWNKAAKALAEARSKLRIQEQACSMLSEIHAKAKQKYLTEFEKEAGLHEDDDSHE